MNYKQVLNQKGLRSTTARIRVLEALSGNCKPIDIAALVKLVNQDDHRCDQATVYRTVDTLVEAGIVQQVDFREGKYRYELEGDHHHHLVCQECGRVEPVYDECVALTNTQIAKKYGFVVSKHYLEFFGLCHQCQSPLNE